MRKNKFVKLLEHILVLLPLLFVASVCLYVIFNENAKDSYFGGTINQESLTLCDSYDDLIVGNTYYLSGKPHETLSNSNGKTITYDNPKVIQGNLTTDEVNAILNGSWFTLTDYTSNYLVLYDSNNTQLRAINLTNMSFSFTFDMVSFTYPNNMTYSQAFGSFVSAYSYNQYTFLSDAFTFSLDKFNQLGFDRINWVNWFTSIFITENNVYVTFLNSYLNYMLLVECCYVVPMVMYWFIHFCEHILYKFENWGD